MTRSYIVKVTAKFILNSVSVLELPAHVMLVLERTNPHCSGAADNGALISLPHNGSHAAAVIDDDGPTPVLLLEYTRCIAAAMHAAVMTCMAQIAPRLHGAIELHSVSLFTTFIANYINDVDIPGENNSAAR